jgi:uncharacterized membrane protein YfcA
MDLSTLWLALSVFLLGMSKGGLPIGGVVLPLLILVWPNPSDAARAAVAFMLPVLCLMDAVAVAFYRRHVDWRRVWPPMPATVVGVVIGSVLFVSARQSFLAVSEKTLRVCIGAVGLVFVMDYVVRNHLLKRAAQASVPGPLKTHAYGLAAGVTSTLAHAAGPIMSMYYLPMRMPKMQFVATTAAYFWLLNALKLIPFVAYGQIKSDTLSSAGVVLPAIPLGVAAGYGLVHVLRPQVYMGLIYTLLFVTSLTLIIKAF